MLSGWTITLHVNILTYIKTEICAYVIHAFDLIKFTVIWEWWTEYCYMFDTVQCLTK